MIYKFFLLANIVFSVAAQLLLKTGMKKIGLVRLDSSILGSFKQMAISPYLWLAAISFVLSFVLYAIVLSKIDLSRSYPIAILGAVILIFTISVIFFGENISSYKIIGIFLCLAGIIFLFK